jgi:predicted ATPase
MKLTARDKEFAVLAACLADAVDGRGRVAAITGAAGTGKTALLHAFGEHAVETPGVRFLQATGSRSEQDLPFGLVGQFFRTVDLAAGPAS